MYKYVCAMRTFPPSLRVTQYYLESPSSRRVVRSPYVPQAQHQHRPPCRSTAPLPSWPRPSLHTEPETHTTTQLAAAVARPPAFAERAFKCSPSSKAVL